MPLILVTNDDGISSPGLLALKQGLESLGEVLVLAPERNWSATSHAKTMHKPLRITAVTLADGSQGYTCSGSPTDCVAMALGGALERKPDLVVSGINTGYNLGSDVTYSGTVACAMEAIILGAPGVAVSSSHPSQVKGDLDAILRLTGETARDVAGRVLRFGLPAQTLINVNVPGIAPAQVRGVRLTRLGGRRYDIDEVIKRADPYGRPYYWLGGAHPIDEDDMATDVGAVKHGYISVTPITLDMTNYSFLTALGGWGFAQNMAASAAAGNGVGEDAQTDLAADAAAQAAEAQATEAQAGALRARGL
jgi:5'-nucleotidase